MLERGEHFTPIVKADANVRTVAIVTVRVGAGQRATASTRMQRIDDRMKDGPKTAAEVKKWVDRGSPASATTASIRQRGRPHRQKRSRRP